MTPQDSGPIVQYLQIKRQRFAGNTYHRSHRGKDLDIYHSKSIIHNGEVRLKIDKFDR